MSEIVTCDKEWSHEELYGVAYDECMKACRDVGFLLDTPNLDKPNILMETIMDELGDRNLVDVYDEFYVEIVVDKSGSGQGLDNILHKSSDEVFAKWDQWIQKHIKDTLLAHKYKYYAE